MINQSGTDLVVHLLLFRENPRQRSLTNRNSSMINQSGADLVVHLLLFKENPRQRS
jgi:hypothetical protein